MNCSKALYLASDKAFLCFFKFKFFFPNLNPKEYPGLLLNNSKASFIFLFRKFIFIPGLNFDKILFCLHGNEDILCLLLSF